MNGDDTNVRIMSVITVVLTILIAWKTGSALDLLDSVFFMTFLFCGVGVAVLLVVFFVGIKVPEYFKNMRKKWEIAANKWEFPVDELLIECSVTGILDITNDKEYQVAYRMVVEILEENKVPYTRYANYTERETIRGYLQVMRSSPEWADSWMMRKVMECYLSKLRRKHIHF